MQITLDYARRPFLPWPMLLTAIGLALLLLAWQGWQAHRLQQQLQGLQWRVNERERMHTRIPPPTQAEQQAVQQRVHQANQLLHELGMPWNALLDGLEQSASTDIALLEVKPQAAKSRLAISGQARNMESLLAYVRALEALDILGDVSIEEHLVLTDQPQRPLEFRLHSRWEIH